MLVDSMVLLSDKTIKSMHTVNMRRGLKQAGLKVDRYLDYTCEYLLVAQQVFLLPFCHILKRGPLIL
jgi:hypothetical protein